MMTVKELIQKLQKCDQDRIVVIQEDEEGNNFSPMADLWCGTYIPTYPNLGDAYIEKLTPTAKKQGFTKEDVRTDGEKAVFLVPLC